MLFYNGHLHEVAVVITSHFIIHQKLKVMEIVKSCIVHLLVSVSLTQLARLLFVMMVPCWVDGGFNQL